MKTRLLLIPLALLLSAAVAQAQLYMFDINLDGSQEPNMPVTSGMGTGSATLQWETLEFTMDFSFSGLGANTTAAHIHRAAIGVNGPVIIPLTLMPLGASWGSGHFEGVVSEAQAWEMVNGNTYLNIHTSAYPGGEIRGQLLVSGAVPEPSTYALFGAGALLIGVAVRRFKARRGEIVGSASDIP